MKRLLQKNTTIYTVFIASIWTILMAISIIWDTANFRTKTHDHALHDARLEFEHHKRFHRWFFNASSIFQDSTLLWTSPQKMNSPTIPPSIIFNELLKFNTKSIYPSQISSRFLPFVADSIDSPVPDPWELLALNELQADTIIHKIVRDSLNAPILRAMFPLKHCGLCSTTDTINSNCGGISISVPLEPFYAELRATNAGIITGHVFLWLIGLIGIISIFNTIYKRSERTIDVTTELNSITNKYDTLKKYSYDTLIRINSSGNILEIFSSTISSHFTGSHYSELFAKNLYEQIEASIIHAKEINNPYSFDYIDESDDVFFNITILLLNNDECFLSINNISSQYLNQKDLFYTHQLWDSISNFSSSLIVILDINYIIQSLNKNIGDFQPNQLIGKNILSLCDSTSYHDLKEILDNTVKKQAPHITELSGLISEQNRLFETNIIPVINDDTVEKLIILSSDITDKKEFINELQLNKLRFQSLYELSQLASESEHQIINFALEKAVEITQSKIGYIFLASEDEEELTLHARSSGVMEECTVAFDPVVYKLSETGLWGEAVRQRKPIITNDYDTPNPFKKGYPTGHVPIKRHMNLPIMNNRGKIKIVAGVGNKEDVYTDTDVQLLELVMKNMWQLIERKRAFNAIRVNQERLKRAQDIARVGHWEWNILNSTLDWSDKVYEIFGYSPKSFTPTYDKFLSYIHPEDRAKVEERVSSILKDPSKGYSITHRIIKQDQSIVYVTEHGRPECNDIGDVVRILGTVQDISQLKQAEMEILHSEEKFHILMDISQDAIFLFMNGRFEIVNQRFTEMTGRTIDDLNDPSFDYRELLPAESHELAYEIIESIRQGNNSPGNIQIDIYDSEKNLTTIEASITRYRRNGDFIMQGILRDISDRVRLEEQLLQSQKMEAIGRLAGGIAHDFNNLLTAISGYAELSRMSLGEDDPLYNDLREISRTTDRAADLTKQLLIFSRKQPNKPDFLNLNEAIRDMGKMLRRVINETIDLRYELDDTTHPIWADKGQIQQIIVNLAVNSRDAMKDGGILTFQTNQVHIDAEYHALHGSPEEGDYVVLSVTDTGTGIPKKIQTRIFDPFFTTKAEGEGTGLGLSTVYGIVQQHSGEIICYSEEGFGTTFKVYLPVATSDKAVKIIRQTEEIILEGSERILIVEDDDIVRNMTERTLLNYGYDVASVSSGEEALEFFDSLKDKPDILLTDVVMKGMNGYEVAERIIKKDPDIRIIFMSGYPANFLNDKITTEMDFLYISKPFKPADLATIIRESLESGTKML